MPDPNASENETRRIASEILHRIESARPPDFKSNLQHDTLLHWTYKGGPFLVSAFRFVDVYPAAQTEDELLEYLHAYVGHPRAILPNAGIPTDAAAQAVRDLITALNRRFVAGDTLEGALDTAERLHDAGQGATLDVLGEAVTSEKEADAYEEAYLALIRAAAPRLDALPPCRTTDKSPFGRVPRLHVSLKLSSLYSRFDPIDCEGSFNAVAPRLRRILHAARKARAAVDVNMEHYARKDLALDIFKMILMEDAFRDYADAGITVQAYLPETLHDLASLLAWVKERSTPVRVRIVKGAYWDHERQVSAYRNWPTPVYLHKEETDLAFEEATRFVLENYRLLRPAIATHNVRSAAHAIAVAKDLDLPPGAVEFQTLLGLGDELRTALAERDLRIRVYVPFGKLVPGMAYLVCRLLEATSRSAFLRQMWRTPLPVEELSARPGSPRQTSFDPADARPSGFGTPFSNEPPSDFSRRDGRDEMSKALSAVHAALGQPHALCIDGADVTTRHQALSLNPARKSDVVGRVSLASSREAARAMRVARKALPSWAGLPVEKRAALCMRAAEIMRSRRLQLAAWEILEVGKQWREADADVAEAIDYLEYYAREAERLSDTRKRNVLGENNETLYEPRGVAVVITPWNFPLAILTGSTAAAVVAGNTVIMKPALQSAVVASQLMRIFREAGFPPGVIQYLPAPGRPVGEYLVKHPDTALVAFTGSLDTGLRIRRLATASSSACAHLKLVIAEMGGKNAILIDRDADLDQAVPGVIASAFDYQGQKCSACSRVIVLEGLYDAFLSRLVSAAQSLPVGPPSDPHYALGPLIDAAAVARVRRYIELARKSARLAFEGDVDGLDDEGFYVPPVIATDVEPDSPLAQEEIFGPVLCVLRARDLSEAITLANGVRFGLTGGLYSRNPWHVARARSELRVGNLYVNRPITGALVDRQPFGGLKLSGLGSKTGGPDYLRQFLQQRTVTEFTVRRGFCPPPD
ncbi:MAG: proline dehydrogenase family protein [Planctomycetota bacterium]